jgi:hypothetical protein
MKIVFIFLCLKLKHKTQLLLFVGCSQIEECCSQNAGRINFAGEMKADRGVWYHFASVAMVYAAFFVLKLL